MKLKIIFATMIFIGIYILLHFSIIGTIGLILFTLGQCSYFAVLYQEYRHRIVSKEWHCKDKSLHKIKEVRDSATCEWCGKTVEEIFLYRRPK